MRMNLPQILGPQVPQLRGSGCARRARIRRERLANRVTKRPLHVGGEESELRRTRLRRRRKEQQLILPQTRIHEQRFEYFRVRIEEKFFDEHGTAASRRRDFFAERELSGTREKLRVD